LSRRLAFTRGRYFRESGLVVGDVLAFTGSADATAVYACINGGGNHPEATNKATVSGQAAAATSPSSSPRSATRTSSSPGQRRTPLRFQGRCRRRSSTSRRTDDSAKGTRWSSNRSPSVPSSVYLDIDDDLPVFCPECAERAAARDRRPNRGSLHDLGPQLQDWCRRLVPRHHVQLRSEGWIVD
jgi:hypothetical protein